MPVLSLSRRASHVSSVGINTHQEMIDKIYQGIRIVTILGLIMLALYVAFWVLKTASFYLFYEDMVRETIIEMVSPEFLR
jgi:hypothetical protein